MTPVFSSNLFASFADRVELRVADVLSNVDCAWPPSEDEKALLRALQGKRGRRWAVPRQELVARLKLSDRAVRDMVHNLRLNFHVQIGASRDGDGGYYLMDDEQDCINASQQMIGHGVAIIRAGMAMRGEGSSMIEVLGQLQLDLASQRPKVNEAKQEKP